jgi:hypothetical protein
MKLEIKTDEAGNTFVELPEAQSTPQPPPTPQQDIKPGRKTSEAVATIVALLAAIAVAKGWLTSAEADAATQALIELIGAISVVAIPALYTLYRTILKLVRDLKQGGCK